MSDITIENPRTNTTAITLDGLKDYTGATIADATVTVTLKKPDGTTVPEVSALTLAAVAGKAGSYAGVAPVFNQPNGAGYNLVYSATKGSSRYEVTRAVTIAERAS